MHRFFQHRLHLLGALEQALVAVEIQRCKSGGAGQRMTRIGVAVEQFDSMRRALHEGVVDLVRDDRAAQGHRRVVHRLGEGDEVGRHAVAFRGEGVSDTAEACDDLVEDQQDSMLVAQRPQPLQIVLGRAEYAGGTREGLDDHRRNRLGAMQGDKSFERIGEIRAACGIAARECHRVFVVGKRQVIIRTRNKRAVGPAIVGDAADGNAAEVHAMIPALAADQAETPALPGAHLVGARDLQRRIRGFRSRIDEEDMVHAVGRQRRDPLCERKGRRMGELERRREIELAGCLADRLDDRLAVVSRVHAPQA